MNVEYVVLVNSSDEETGIMEKQEAHKLGVLHRAFSVMLFNEQGEILLQQRALSKYHSGGLWTNACCSHPRPGEMPEDAAHRRIKEELGISCNLHFKDRFIYKAPFDNGLTEHELDYVFEGIYGQDFHLNPEEVAKVRWVKKELLFDEMNEKPEDFTVWFRIIMDRYR